MSAPRRNPTHSRTASMVAACVTAVALIALPGSSASANGDWAEECVYHVTTNGGSHQGTGGYTTSGGNCGTQSVRVGYKTYSGSPVYWTSWKTGQTYISYNPGNTIVGGQHKSNDPAPAYAGSFPFST